MANTDPILTSESSVGRGQWNKGSLQVDGDFVLPESINEFTNPELRQEGKLRYDTTSNCPVYYNGTEWVKLDPKTLQEITDEGNVTDNSIGIGTSAAPLAHLHIGNINSTRSSNPHLLLAETIDDVSGSGNAHGFADSSIFSREGLAYASFDGRTILRGGDLDHYVSFQHQPLVEITGNIENIYGVFTRTQVETGATVNYNFGFYAYDPNGAGTIENNYGIFIPAQTKGTVQNWSIYTGVTPSRFGGDVVLHNTASSAGSGSKVIFKSGTSSAGQGAPEAIIVHELISGSQGNLNFRVRTSATTGEAGLTEVMSIDGGSTPSVNVTGKLTASVAPTNPTDVIRKTEFDSIKDGNLSKTANYTILPADYGKNGEVTVYVDATSGAVQIDLETSALMSGKTVNVIKTDASVNSVTVKGNGSTNINGANTYVLSGQYQNAIIKSNGTQYYILG